MPSLNLPNLDTDTRSLAAKIVGGIAIVACLGVALVMGPFHGFLTSSVKVSGPVEYSNAPVDIESYLTGASDVTMTVNGEVDTTQVGYQKIPVTLAKWGLTRNVDVTVTVQDTQPPVIAFKKETISIEAGETFRPTENIASVTDPVDGELVRVKEEQVAQATKPGIERFFDQGWYIAPTTFTADKAGNHEVTVKAVDRHGNETTASFTLTVLDPLAEVKLNKKDKFVEYGTDSIDATTLVTCSDKDASVSAMRLDTSKIGKQQIEYTIAKHKSTTTKVRTFYVRDTQPPAITLEGTQVTVDLGSTYEPSSNVIAAVDPVDGSLNITSERPTTKAKRVGRQLFYDNGWYLVSGTVNTQQVGTYPVTVTACDKHGNEVTAEFTVVVEDPINEMTLSTDSGYLEYARRTIDPTTLVTCSVPDVSISAPSLDLSSVGSKTVTFTVTKNGSTREGDLTFVVQDTEPPVISLGADEVVVEAGSGYDPYTNVRSVSDPVDGNLERVNSDPGSAGNGWYTIEGSYNTNAAGSYTLTVYSSDRNGNTTSRQFVLTVTD